MRIYNTQEEFNAEVVKDVFSVNDDVLFNFNLDAECSITAHNITAYNINANDITAHNITAHNINANDINTNDITAHNITAHNINACHITAHDITAYNINASDINASDINASDINASDINASDISYYAHCIAYDSINCTDIKGRRLNSFHKCLDGRLKIRTKTYKIKIDDKEIELSEESYNNFKKQFKD